MAILSLAFYCQVAVLFFLRGVSSEQFTIVGVVDSADRAQGANLDFSMGYVNQTNTHKVTLRLVDTQWNDTYGAMEDVCDLLPGQIDAIVDVSSQFVSAAMRSLGETMGIAYIGGADVNLYELLVDPGMSWNTSVRVEPPYSTMLRVIRSIVEQENLTNVGIIYDHTFNLDDKPKRLLRNLPAQHLYLRMADENEMGRQLDLLKNADLTYLFLACDKENAELYLQKAHERGMMKFKFNWYIVTQDSQVRCSLCEIGTSVVEIRGTAASAAANRYVNYKDNHLSNAGVNFELDDLKMGRSFDFDLINMTSTALFELWDAGEWSHVTYPSCSDYLLTDPNGAQMATKLKDHIKTMTYGGIFGGFFWQGDQAQQSMNLTISRVTFRGTSPSDRQQVGNWTLDKGLQTNGHPITSQHIQKTYRIVTIHEPPFIFRQKVLPEKAIDHYYYNATTGFYYYGYCIDLIYYINDTMGFNFVLYEPQDGAYGSMQENGSWNGMVRELIEDRADIAVGTLAVMAERENVVDFTVPYYDLVGITILMKKPKFEYSVFKFMSVLEDAVWGCILSAFIIVSILLAVFDRFSPYSYQNNRESWDGHGEEPRVFTLKEGLWFCMTSLTPQGGGEAPRALSGRLVAATWWMFGFIMIATYTANLAAFLTVSRLDQPIESLDDLAKQFKTKYAPQQSTSTETYFKRMKDIEEKFYTIWKAMSLNDSLDQVERAKLAVWDYPVSDKFTNMWVSMSETTFPKNLDEARRRILNDSVNGEEFAFIGDATQNKYATLTDCNLWEVGEEFSRKPYALAVQEGSPLKNQLSNVILQLLNQRVLEDLKTKWWDFDRLKCDKPENESDGISIYNIGGVFLVILIGIGLGLITLLFEFYWYKWRPGAAQKKEKQNCTVISVKHAQSNPAFNGKE